MAIRNQLVTAMANHVSVRIRDWAEDNMPAQYGLRVVVRDDQPHVDVIMKRYHRTARRWAVSSFVFPHSATDAMIDSVLRVMINELSVLNLSEKSR